jgi:riboflavin synthase
LVEKSAGLSVVEVSPETLSRTTLDWIEKGSAVNLEPALCMGDPLGGHWVQGHVDGILEVLDRRDLTDHRELIFGLPEEHRPMVVGKGSVTLDGVSLTVAQVQGDRFSVALIPHTLEVTTLAELNPGGRVNFEPDILAKYVRNAVASMLPGAP